MTRLRPVAALVLGVAACRGANAGAVATQVGTAAAVTVAEGAMRAAATGPDTSHVTADLNDPPPSRPQIIDLPHARAVLIETSLAPCWPAGVPRLPRDVQVTFRNDGTVSRVAVPQPKGAVTFSEPCVIAKLKDVIVDPFMGPDVIVGFTAGEP